jgi:para-nitrobenzyl esterase
MVTHLLQELRETGRFWRAQAAATLGFAGIILAAGAQGACSSSSNKGSSSDDGGGGATTVPSSTDCTATVTQGAMSGKTSGSTSEYLGIPYAKPPVGDLRWMPPEAAGPFATTPLDATAFGASCEQFSGGSSILDIGINTPSEDCLFVNVYTPQNAPPAPLPVMVFIYGGAFNTGSSSLYNGVGLSEKGPVVLVTLNYRLGAFGFLALPELDAQRGGKPSGSDGIRDQQLALQWVHDNISVFHGDPTNVTVFGESAGSLSTCLHIVSPGSQGLAKRYIMESVACVGNGEPVDSQQQAYAVGQAFASSLCGGDGGAAGNGEDLLMCLRAQSVNDITAWLPAAGSLPATPTNALLGTLIGPPFTPTVEGDGGVLPDTPANLIAQGQFDTSAEILAGTNLNEFGLFTDLAKEFGGAPQIVISSAAQLDQGLTTAFGANASAVEQQYQPITDTNASQVLVNIVTDYAFRCPMRQLSQMLQSKGVSNYYLYSFEQGPAWHSFELEPLFDETALVALGDTPQPSAAFTQTMLGYWTQFGATGNPNGAGDAGLPNWPVNSVAGTDQYMQLVDPTPDAMAHLAQANCEFWANVAPLIGGSTPDGGADTGTSEAGSGPGEAGAASDEGGAVIEARRIR